MAQKSPLVSVIIPCFNSEHWIRACLDSITAQTWHELEIIVVDDGSTDHTAELIKGHPDPRISYIYQSNAGPCAARNRALAECKGDYIQFFDSDDVMGPNKIKMQVQKGESEAGKLVSCSWAPFDTIPDDVEPLGLQVFRDLTRREFYEHYFDCEKGDLPCPVFLCPRSIVDRTGLWNETLVCNNDGEYVARMVAESDGIVYTHNCIGLFYRRRSSSVSTIDSSEKVASWISALDTIAELASSSGLILKESRLAKMYQSLMIHSYPLSRPHMRTLEQRIDQYGGTSSTPILGGRSVNAISRILGWRTAKLLQYAYRRCIEKV